MTSLGKWCQVAVTTGEYDNGRIAWSDGEQMSAPPQAITATMLIKEIGFEPVLVGGLAMGKYLVPGTPLGGEHTPAEIREIAAKLS